MEESKDFIGSCDLPPDDNNEIDFEEYEGETMGQFHNIYLVQICLLFSNVILFLMPLLKVYPPPPDQAPPNHEGRI